MHALYALPLTLLLTTPAVAWQAPAKQAAKKQAPKKETPAGPQRWEKTIAAFEQQDREQPPEKGGVLFVGSSSIRQWKLDKWFPSKTALNRGFGGSEVADTLHFADRIVLPYEPRTIVMYAGDNDVSRGTTPKQVAANYGKFVAVVRDKLPQARIVFVAIKPSIKRWSLVEKMRAANALVRKQCEADPLQTFVDIDTPMIGGDGKPKPELFAKDGLHLSDEGYRLWTSLVAPHLE